MFNPLGFLLLFMGFLLIIFHSCPASYSLSAECFQLYLTCLDNCSSKSSSSLHASFSTSANCLDYGTNHNSTNRTMVFPESFKHICIRSLTRDHHLQYLRYRHPTIYYLYLITWTHYLGPYCNDGVDSAY